MEPSIILSAAELFDLTGYKQPAAQLAELHRCGFVRARLMPVNARRTNGPGVILERTHYEAVTAGPARQAAETQEQPAAGANVAALLEWAEKRNQRLAARKRPKG